MLPFDVEKTFQLSENLHIDYKQNYVIIDNLYKNITDICNLLKYSPVENYGETENNGNDTSNFHKYYDCRPYFANWSPRINLLDYRKNFFVNICKRLLPKNYDLEFGRHIMFNCFKNLDENISSNLQHAPHIDENCVNILTYIDPICDGGTALYKNVNLSENSKDSLLQNTSQFEILDFIPAKQNRCVIFDGNIPHGAVIDDYKNYSNDWRITQISFVRYNDVRY